MVLSVFALFCTIAASGVPLIVSRKTAELTAKRRESEINSVITGATLLSLGVTTVIVVAVFLFREKLEFLFTDERCPRLFLILLPSLISTVIYQLVRGYLMGKKHYIEYSATELLEEVIRIVACFTLLSNALLVLSSETALALAFTITDYLVMAVLLVMYFLKGGRIAKPKGLKETLSSGAPITIMRVAAGFISSFIAISLPAALVRNGLTASEAAAEYGRAVGMAFSLLFAPLSLTSALSVVILPEAAALAAKGNLAELRIRVENSITFIFIFTVFFYSLYLVLGESYGTLLFGDAKAGEFISFSSGMVLPAALSGLINTTLNSLGEEKKVFAAFGLSAVVLVAEIILLPKYLGIYALAVAESSFYLLQFTLGFVLLFKKKACGANVFRPALTTMLIAFPTVLSIKLIDLLCAKLTSSLLLRAGFATLAGGAVYLLLLIVFRPIPSIKAIFFSRRCHSFRTRRNNTIKNRHQKKVYHHVDQHG